MTAAPRRIQRSRAKGWRLPAGAVYVGRPSKWGNPWRAEVVDGVGWCCTNTQTRMTVRARDAADAHAMAVERYRAWLAEHGGPSREAIRADLRGKVLCCWCPPRLVCHADVLLAIANEPEGKSPDD